MDPIRRGQTLCPGRHFAKEEILLSVAMMCSMFDIELLGSGGKKGGRYGLLRSRYAAAEGEDSVSFQEEV